jgi:hypothetical protein
VPIRSAATSGPLVGSGECGSAGSTAEQPGSGGVAHRTPVDFPSRLSRLAPLIPLALGAGLLALWLLVDPRTPDLAAQVYRVNLFRQVGFAVWDSRWYGGHHLPGYSLLFPPLGSLLGARALGALSALASIALFSRLGGFLYGSGARWGAAWFAVAAVGDVWIGRLSFALGVPFALAAVFALVRGRSLAAGTLAALCAAASPVAGVLLALAGVSGALSRRTPGVALALAAPVAAVVVPLALLFPEGGFEPYPLLSFLATALVLVAFLAALPPHQPVLRVGAVVYATACVLCLLLRSPMGSNVERYAVLLAGPLLLCARLGARGAEAIPRPGIADGPVRASSRGRRAVGMQAERITPVVVGALLLTAAWVGWGPVRETLAVAGDESTSASYYAPVERFLAARARAGGPLRIEVPLTRSHWEAALLAPTVSLARGWEKQLEDRFDRVLLAPGLTAASYGRWLRSQAVSYVALPDTPLDPSSAQEGRLIVRGLPYLREVFASRHWRIYEVLAAEPLAVGAGRLTFLGHDSFKLRTFSAGSTVVRVRFTRYWTIVHGGGCVAPAPGGWTSVTAHAPGTVLVRARFSLARAFSSGGSCTPVVPLDPGGHG